MYTTRHPESLLYLIVLHLQVLDYDLMELLITHIDQNGDAGAILVFLPGQGTAGSELMYPKSLALPAMLMC